MSRRCWAARNRTNNLCENNGLYQIVGHYHPSGWTLGLIEALTPRQRRRGNWHSTEPARSPPNNSAWGCRHNFHRIVSVTYAITQLTCTVCKQVSMTRLYSNVILSICLFSTQMWITTASYFVFALPNTRRSFWKTLLHLLSLARGAILNRWTAVVIPLGRYQFFNLSVRLSVCHTPGLRYLKAFLAGSSWNRDEVSAVFLLLYLRKFQK